MGLGNPGPAYSGNRHNVGFMVLDALAGRESVRFKSHKTLSDVVEGRLTGVRAVLAKPRSFMNDSGGPVAALRTFFAAEIQQIIVVHDDLDLSFGDVRVKQGGGDGGHNGLRSITKSLGSNDYLRVRVGIGRPPGRMDAADFVLRDFSATERKLLPNIVDDAADAVESLIARGLAATQNLLH